MIQSRARAHYCMLHTQIEHDDVIKRYISRRLTTEERRAFEEHYFACDECFDKVRAMEQFAAGIQDLAERGELREVPDPQKAPEWLVWAFAGTSIATIALAVMAGWAYLHRLPELQRQLAAENQTQPQTTTVAQFQPEAGPQANVPLVVLEASRGQEAATVVLAPNAPQLIIWMEPGHTRYSSYSVELDSASGARIMTVDGLTPSPYGALAVGLPAQQLQPGIFRVKLIGQSPPPGSLVSEYRLQIRRP